MNERFNEPAYPVKHGLIMSMIDSAGESLPLDTVLSFEPEDPYAVSATFTAAKDQPKWTFGRELLLNAITGEDNPDDGDVLVWSQDTDGEDAIIFELNSPDGEALLQASKSDIVPFVTQVYQSVPDARAEHICNQALKRTIQQILLEADQ